MIHVTTCMHTIAIMYPKVMNITCFSHALDIVGSKFVTPILGLQLSSIVKKALEDYIELSLMSQCNNRD